MSNPLVSVIVPCYNHERYIVECIESIMRQSYKKFELIVIDDGSIDGSVKKLKSLQEKYGFKLFEQPNRGVAKTLNRAIHEIACGGYITFCASDDFWISEKLEKQVCFLDANPQYPMCYGKNHFVNENSEIIQSMDYINENLRGGYIFEDIILFKLHPPVTYMFRAAIFKELGGYPQGIATEDFYMNLKIASRYPIGYIDDYLGYYRFFDVPKKMLFRHKTFESHEKCITEYKNSIYYKKSLKVIRLNKIGLISAYSNYKFQAILELLKNREYFFSKGYIKSLIKLFFIWKRL